MPELPEVETVCRGLAEVMEGRVLKAVAQNRPDLRFPFPERFAARLTGRRIAVMNRRAKYILAHLDAGEVLIMHLGMSGRFTIEAPDRTAPVGEFHHAGGTAGGPHDHVVFELDDGCRIVYSDPRRFGMMDLCAADGLDEHRLLRHLGIEPLGNGLTAAWLAEALAGRRTSLKAALLDQKVIAGVGNIYACEALFRARLSPSARQRRSAVRAGRPAPAPRTSSPPSARFLPTPSPPAARPCAIMPGPTANSAIFSTPSTSTTGKASPAPGRGAWG